MVEKVQLTNDLKGLARASKASSVPMDLGTLVGMHWGLGSIETYIFEAAVAIIPADDVLLRLSGTSLQFLDTATGTVEYAVLEVPDIGA